MLRAFLSRIRATFERRHLDEQAEREIEDHLELLADRFARQGMDPDEARYAAKRQFGGITQMKQQLREKRALPVDVMLQDLRHAFRQLRKAKGFTASAALTLALGIGASTAIFAILDTVVLRPLPFPAPERLMAVRAIDRRGTPHPTNLSYPNFFDFRSKNHVFEHLASYRGQRMTVSDSPPAIQVIGMIVSWDIFPTLGVEPALGRGFLLEEEKPGKHVTVLSDALWKSRFAGDRGILGRAIRVDGVAFTVVGVAPPGFQFPDDAPPIQLWTTLSEDSSSAEGEPLSVQRGARVMEVVGRLKAGASPQQAQAEMDEISGALALQYPDDDQNVAKTLVTPEQERLVGDTRKPLWILLGAVALVLLIGCANVANLLLARGTERMREFTLRIAMGASRIALVRQLLTESVALAALGSAGGVLLAWAALKYALPLAGDSLPIPRLAQTGLDGRVVAFSIVLALTTCVLFSVAPAAQAVRVELTGVLKEGASNIARGRHRLRGFLVVGQITLGLTLLVGAEMLIANFIHLMHRDLGFRPGNLLTFEVGLSESRYNTAAQVGFYDLLMERLRAIPGVTAVAMGGPRPLTGHEMSISFDIEERPAPAPARPHSDMAIITPGYFNTMGISLRQGRDFTERDDITAPRVLIVNQAFARRFFPGENAIGKRIMPGATNGKEGTLMREIVGVVADAKQVPWTDEPDPIYYFPYKQLSWNVGALVLRTAIPPQQLEAAARAELTSLDREAPMFNVQTGDELSSSAVAVPRFLTVLMGAFAAIALVLTVVGLYGVLSYAVARRRREIGVRIALGAGRNAVLGLVLREAMALVAVGLVLGLAGSLGVSRLVESLASGVPAGNPIFLAVACGIMVVTSLLAAYLPARRAASVDPMRALRSE